MAFEGETYSWDRQELRDIYAEENDGKGKCDKDRYSMRVMAKDFNLNVTTLFRVINGSEQGMVTTKKWLKGNIENFKRG